MNTHEINKRRARLNSLKLTLIFAGIAGILMLFLFDWENHNPITNRFLPNERSFQDVSAELTRPKVTAQTADNGVISIEAESVTEQNADFFSGTNVVGQFTQNESFWKILAELGYYDTKTQLLTFENNVKVNLNDSASLESDEIIASLSEELLTSSQHSKILGENFEASSDALIYSYAEDNEIIEMNGKFSGFIMIEGEAL